MQVTLSASLLTVAALAGSCPIVTYAEMPNEDNEYPGMRSEVVKTPDLLRDPSNNAFLGTMGPCGNDSLYQSYVNEGELYHCNLGSTLMAWAALEANVGTEYCTWGYGELAPPGTSTNPDEYTLSPSQATIVDTLGEGSFTTLATNILSYQWGETPQCEMVGQTAGAARSKQMCVADPLNENCQWTDQILQYSTAFASFKINDTLQTFMDRWRSTPAAPADGSTGGHADNIGTGEVQGFMGAWVQKVVKCSDLPAWTPDPSNIVSYSPRMITSGGADANVEAWQKLESVWYPTNDNNDGCGYVGTSNNVSAVRFGAGCEGCTELTQANYENDPNSPSYDPPADLLWLWITLPIVVVLLAGMGYYFVSKKSKVDRGAALIAHADN